MHPRLVKKALQYINTLLVAKQYDQILREDAVKRITAEDLRLALEEYGGNVTAPPDEAYENVYIYEHEDAEHEVTAEMYLWIDYQQSDLTLSCDIGTDGTNFYFAIDDILVL